MNTIYLQSCIFKLKRLCIINTVSNVLVKINFHMKILKKKRKTTKKQTEKNITSINCFFNQHK